ATAAVHQIDNIGARILTTLLYTLKQTNTTRGVASLCIGGGEAVAVMVERS
ncbi:MAG: acetyl-CoA C-acetyltransferase, partial [Nannocystaceae bacterium]